MKRLFGVLFIIGLIGAAQDAAAQKIGVFLGYGTEVEELGLGVNGEFAINDKVAIAPSFIYWFPEDPVSWWEFNANAMYYFTKSGSADFYGLAGINLFSAKVEGFDGNSEVGINLGVGANFNIGKNWEPFTELKFVLGDADQLGLFFGARFKLRK
ncbi:MAG: outer membrane beta-barrel protein [Flammeovirgaceae bacterium]|nr:MAG: outer membrane beta-barrel protein [Flammeovirgaceae bacterium]